MKKILVIALIALTFITGCSKENYAEENKTTESLFNSSINYSRVGNRYIAADFDFVGEEHNRILGLFYDGVITEDLPTDEIDGFMKDLLINETKQYTTADETELTHKIINETVEIKPEYDTSVDLYSSLPNADSLSTDCKLYLDNLHALIYDYDQGVALNDIITNIKDLEVVAENDFKLDNKDLYFIFTATSIAKKSLEYWDLNFDDWNTGFSAKKEKPKTPGQHIGTIAASDVAGGVGAAAGAWAVNVFVGPGQVAYGGAIVGGAVGGSVVAAGMAIYESIMTLW